MICIYLTSYITNFALVESALVLPIVPNLIAAIACHYLIKFLVKYTTIGNRIWFGELVGYITDRISNTKIKQWITNRSYSKAFICEPCHIFWLTLILGSIINFAFSSQLSLAIVRQAFIVLPWAILSYIKSKKRR